jgi:hypothetical protein
MSIILDDSDDFVTEIKTEICDFHKKFPGTRMDRGCMCYVVLFKRKATLEEKATNMKRKRVQLNYEGVSGVLTPSWPFGGFC